MSQIKTIVHFLKKKIKNVVFFILFVLCVVLLVLLIKKYKHRTKYEPLLIKKARKINPYIIPNKKIIQSQNGIQYAYSFWINMNNVSGSENWKQNYYDDRNIFHKGANPSFSYNPENNIYRIGIVTKLEDEMIETLDIKQVPFQKWNHFVLSLHHRNIDIFLNGMLKHSYLLKNVPIFNDESLVFGSMKAKVNGSITNVRYFHRHLTKREVRGMYHRNKNKQVPNASFSWWLYP